MSARHLISHDLGAHDFVTGSIETGRHALRAAAGPMIKRTHLELGGKAPVIVCDDADLDRLVETLREASFYNAGQDCTAACRIFAHDQRIQTLTDKLQAMIGTARSTGNPSGTTSSSVPSSVHVNSSGSMAS